MNLKEEKETEGWTVPDTTQEQHRQKPEYALLGLHAGSSTDRAYLGRGDR